jgi:hypothetical protein
MEFLLYQGVKKDPEGRSILFYLFKYATTGECNVYVFLRMTAPMSQVSFIGQGIVLHQCINANQCTFFTVLPYNVRVTTCAHFTWDCFPIFVVLVCMCACYYTTMCVYVVLCSQREY